MKIKSMTQPNEAILYIVATPIGNLQDMTLRAIDTLKNVACIAAEDTRHSLPLLRHFAISTPIVSLHQHNERERTQKLLTLLQENKSVALISDAGTPLISDPGFILVSEARKLGIRVIPIPGPCAAIAALSAAGLATDRFLFEGFLPTRNKLRQQRLESLSRESCTLIFYEAPHRIVEFFAELKTFFGEDRQAVVARELTKKFETIHGGKIGELIHWMNQDSNQCRGEFVILVSGAAEVISETQHISSEHIVKVLLEELPLKQAVELAAKITRERKNNVYQLALQLKNK